MPVFAAFRFRSVHLVGARTDGSEGAKDPVFTENSSVLLARASGARGGNRTLASLHLFQSVVKAHVVNLKKVKSCSLYAHFYSHLHGQRHQAQEVPVPSSLSDLGREASERGGGIRDNRWD